MRGLEGIGDLSRDGERLVDGYTFRASPQASVQRLAFHELENQEADTVRVFEAVDRANVRMIQRGEHPRFALEARKPVRVAREPARQDLYRDVAPEPCVARAVHL